MYSTLRAVLSYAEAADLIDRSPCRGIRLPRVPLVNRPVLSAAELERLAQSLGPDQALFMWLGVVLGLRWSEVAGLRTRDVDLTAGTVTVAVQLGRDGQLSIPKSTAGLRTLSTPAWLVDELSAHLSRRGLGIEHADDLVFVGLRGGPLNHSGWRRHTWVRACEAAGLPGLTFHDLRSMAATALVATGADVKTAQRRLGHSTPFLTLQTYARATEQADRSAAEAVGKWLRPRDKRAMCDTRSHVLSGYADRRTGSMVA
jgi:integrase